MDNHCPIMGNLSFVFFCIFNAKQFLWNFMLISGKKNWNRIFRNSFMKKNIDVVIDSTSHYNDHNKISIQLYQYVNIYK